MDKKDAKIEDLAKERAAKKDNYGNSKNFSLEKNTSLSMSELIGVDLGCSLDMLTRI